MTKNLANLVKIFIEWISKFKKNKMSYKTKAEKNKNKIIRKEANEFKRLCIKEFKHNIKRGIATTIVDFNGVVSYVFEDETSKIVLEELTKKYKNIEFSFSFGGFRCSYKGIKMVAK